MFLGFVMQIKDWREKLYTVSPAGNLFEPPFATTFSAKLSKPFLQGWSPLGKWSKLQTMDFLTTLERSPLNDFKIFTTVTLRGGISFDNQVILRLMEDSKRLMSKQ